MNEEIVTLEKKQIKALKFIKIVSIICSIIYIIGIPYSIVKIFMSGYERSDLELIITSVINLASLVLIFLFAKKYLANIINEKMIIISLIIPILTVAVSLIFDAAAGEFRQNIYGFILTGIYHLINIFLAVLLIKHSENLKLMKIVTLVSLAIFFVGSVLMFNFSSDSNELVSSATFSIASVIVALFETLNPIMYTLYFCIIKRCSN
jgi:hypothetical protein